MEYRLLKMELHKLPWKELYENEFPRVRRNIDMMVVEDNYDDKNYGLYSGDEKKAFSHAYSTYLKLLEYTSKSMKHQKEIEALQNVLLQDVQNYLTACACTLKNDKREIEQLIIMLGETCANQKMVDFVLKYWERERQSALEYYSEFEERKEEYSVTLDFPFVYSYIGDRVLYETGNIDLAIQFYQLETLEWFENKNTTEWQRYIADYKQLRDGGEAELSFAVEWRELQICLKDYNQFYLIYKNKEINRKQWVTSAETFAFSFEVLVDKVFSDYVKSQYYNMQNLRADFRACFIMALKVYNDAFLWEVLSVVENQSHIVLQQYVIEGLLHSSNDIFNAVKQYVISLPDKARGASYERVFTLLAETAYVILIKRILLERELKQDIGYYTSLDTFRYILPERADKKAGRLSVMHVAYMNDPNEGKTFWHFIRNKKDEKMNVANRRVTNYPFVFLKCFTPVIDDLPMWEMYGNRAEGCCVILKKEWFRDKVHVPLYRVCYLRKKGNSYQFYKEDNPRIAHADELIEYLSKLHDLYRTLPGNDLSKKYFRVITEQIAFLFKDANYQHEQELRIMYWYNESSSDFEYTAVEDAKKDYPKLYVSPETYVDIQEIILGPKVRESNSKVPYLQEEFEKLSKKTGYKVPEITLSEIEYR